jgi:hypothetical protein
MNYVDYNYYTETYGGTAITADNAPKAFQIASKTIDTLTYCRIVERGLEGLTAFQKDIVHCLPLGACIFLKMMVK